MCIVIQLIADCIAYRLTVLLNEYLEFSGVNGFISAIFRNQLIPLTSCLTATLRNQVCAGCRPARAWFKKFFAMLCAYVAGFGKASHNYNCNYNIIKCCITACNIRSFTVLGADRTVSLANDFWSST